MLALQPAWALTALLAGAAGVAGLFLSWRQRGAWSRGRHLLRAASWCALIGSAVPWMQAGGADRGVALALVWVSLAAIALIGATGDWRAAGAARRRSSRRAGTSSETDASPGVSNGTWLTLLLAGAALLPALALALAITTLDLAGATESMLGIMGVPLLWALGMVYACTGQSWQRRVWALAVPFALGGAITVLNT